MLIFPNCKINLGLHITAKRADGYHNVETVFYPLNIKDALEIVTLPAGNTMVEFSQSGLTVDGKAEDNLCIKAYHLLKKDFPDIPPVKMHLHKTIPMGAGLGGGSADGAFTLKLLNDKFNLHLTSEQLINYAVMLGSDCAFFIINKPCFARGRGEVLSPLQLDLSQYKTVIVNPGIHINTAWAFKQITPAAPAKTIKDIIMQPVSAWKAELTNDFEAPVAKQYPEIAQIKEALYAAGAEYASMTGSGSTVFGLFKNNLAVDLPVFPPHWLCRVIPNYGSH